MNLQGCTEMKKFEGKRVCVACSGGADSLCLLHYLYKRAPSDGFFLSAVHVEHGLRGESSKEDAAFVAKFCDTLHIPLYTFTFDCRALAKKNGTGIEEAARNARYGAFKMLLSENKGKVFSLQEIYEAVWKDTFLPSASNTVMVHIRNLREKLKQEEGQGELIKNKWGRGYYIE